MKHKEKLTELLAAEYNCPKEAFFSGKNILTESKLLSGRRMYGSEKYFFHMVSLGRGAVITADLCLHPFLNEYIKGKTGFWLFEIPNLMTIEKELNRFSYTLSQTHHMFLPSVKADPEKEYSVKWYRDKEIHGFYGDRRLPNAICERFLPNRPDRLAVAAFDGENMMGMAGCSEDAPGWFQIGIDVLPEYRSRGVGTYLVTLLKNKIEEEGGIPFYGTGVSNYHSWNIAIKSGFMPTWIEIGAKKIE